jgi:asparagine synthase (glutamine-hydrolysing)
MTRGPHTIVFNGEIYNFRELRRELEKAGYEFSTDCDTEAALYAYSHWGAEFVNYLEGMFALALWDAAKRELLLSRDRVGKKPLFFFENGRQFVFGSEIKAVLAALPSKPPLDQRALDDYLTYFYVPYPRTMFEGIRQLEPAKCLRVRLSDNRLSTQSYSYWHPVESATRVKCGSARENQRTLVDLLSKAVSERMISDVPLGLLLSGGLDSGTIMAMMARASAAPVRSFSVGFKGHSAYDEIEFSKIVAEQFGSEHRVLNAEVSGAASLAKIIWHFDQPFGNPTAVLAYELSALTKKSVTVALCGDGGDELFGGYPRYLGAYASGPMRRLPDFVRHRILPWLGGQISDDTHGRHQFRRMREFLEYCNQPLIEMYLEWIGYFSAREKANLYEDNFARCVKGQDSGEFVRRLYQESEGLEPLNRLAYVDIRSFLCCNVLEYADRMSMAHALELRAPFCDRRLIEFSLSVPFNQKFRFGQSKWILREAMKSTLPQAVLKRKKLGFNPPTNAWLRGELRALASTLLGPDGILKRGLFRPVELQRLLEQHCEGVRDVSLKMWALIALEIWFRLYQDSTDVDELQEQLNAMCSSSTARSSDLAGSLV